MARSVFASFLSERDQLRPILCCERFPTRDPRRRVDGMPNSPTHKIMTTQSPTTQSSTVRSKACRHEVRRLVTFATTLIMGLGLHIAPAVAQSAVGHSPASEFARENAVAMDKMMAAMHTRSNGDVDADFVAMMVPHHQGAIDMAMALLRYGRNEQLRRLAQEIIVEQQQEIAAMKMALRQPLPVPAAAPTQITPSVGQHHGAREPDSRPRMALPVDSLR